MCIFQVDIFSICGHRGHTAHRTQPCARHCPTPNWHELYGANTRRVIGACPACLDRVEQGAQPEEVVMKTPRMTIGLRGNGGDGEGGVQSEPARPALPWGERLKVEGVVKHQLAVKAARPLFDEEEQCQCPAPGTGTPNKPCPIHASGTLQQKPRPRLTAQMPATPMKRPYKPSSVSDPHRAVKCQRPDLVSSMGHGTPSKQAQGTSKVCPSTPGPKGGTSLTRKMHGKLKANTTGAKKAYHPFNVPSINTAIRGPSQILAGTVASQANTSDSPHTPTDQQAINDASILNAPRAHPAGAIYGAASNAVHIDEGSGEADSSNSGARDQSSSPNSKTHERKQPPYNLRSGQPNRPKHS